MILNHLLILIPIQYSRSASPIIGDIPVSARGRLLEVLDEPATLEQLDPKTRELVLARTAIDIANDAYAFDLSHGWPSAVSTPRGVIALNTTSGIISPVSASFKSIADSRLTVKFMHDCRINGIVAHKTVPHPSLKNFWFGSAANAAKVSASHHYVSPPVPFPSGLFTPATPHQVALCQRANAAVRFVVYHDPRGESLRTVLSKKPSRRFDPLLAFAAGARLIEMVKDLHNAGIVHGNLRLEDVGIAFPKQGQFIMSLVAFGSDGVSWATNTTGKSLAPLPRKPISVQAYLQSPWELFDGVAHQYTMRDDMYRAIQLISILLNGLDHEDFLSKIASERPLAEYKLLTPALAPSVLSNPLRCIPLTVEDQTRVMILINKINAKVLDMKTVGYDDIIAKLNEIHNLLRSRQSVPSVALPADCVAPHPTVPSVPSETAPARRVVQITPTPEDVEAAQHVRSIQSGAIPGLPVPAQVTSGVRSQMGGSPQRPVIDPAAIEVVLPISASTSHRAPSVAAPPARRVVGVAPAPELVKAARNSRSIPAGGIRSLHVLAQVSSAFRSQMGRIPQRRVIDPAATEVVLPVRVSTSHRPLSASVKRPSIDGSEPSDSDPRKARRTDGNE